MNKIAFEGGRERNAEEYTKLRDSFKSSALNLYRKLYNQKPDALSNKDTESLNKAAQKQIQDSLLLFETMSAMESPDQDNYLTSSFSKVTELLNQNSFYMESLNKMNKLSDEELIKELQGGSK